MSFTTMLLHNALLLNSIVKSHKRQRVEQAAKTCKYVDVEEITGKYIVDNVPLYIFGDFKWG